MKRDLAVKVLIKPDKCFSFLLHFHNSNNKHSAAVSLNLLINVAFRFEQSPSQKQFPLLTSACPGWICYAEKTHGNFILPYISKVKSPQQVMGSLVKYYFSRQLGITPDRVYHMSIMPCYDKKLEASREDFYNDIYKSRDVDLVITSLEIEGMLQEKGVDLRLLSTAPVDPQLSLIDERGQLLSHRGSSSGGYLEHVFKYAAGKLFGNELKHDSKLDYKVLRNKDFQEVTLTLDGEEKLKFAFAFGFRNIQNIVQKIKRKKCSYHFVEIMACPSGCVNGGGQIRADTKEEAKELLERTESLYQSLPSVPPKNFDEKVKDIREKLRESVLPSEEKQDFILTEYHEVKKNTTALNIKW